MDNITQSLVEMPSFLRFRFCRSRDKLNMTVIPNEILRDLQVDIPMISSISDCGVLHLIYERGDIEQNFEWIKRGVI